MANEILFEDFKTIAKFEINHIVRFQCPDEFCIAFIRPENRQMFSKLKKIIIEALRSTDIVAEKDGNLFVLLVGTNKQGVEFITKAIYDFFNGEVLEVYVDYPYDGKNIDELFDVLAKEVEKKYGFLIGKYLH